MSSTGLNSGSRGVRAANMAIQPKSGSRTGGRRNQVPNKTGQEVNPYLGAQQLHRPKTGLGPMRNLATSNTMVSIGAMG